MELDQADDSKLRSLVEEWKECSISLPLDASFTDPVDNFVYNQLILAKEL
jgi:hypothetical protein